MILRRFRLVMVAKITLLITISLLAQTQPGMPMAGSYTILVDGKPAGVERFEQAATAQNLIIKSTTEITSGGQAEKLTVMTELRGSKPVRYEVESSGGGRNQKYTLLFEAGAANVVIEAYGRRSERIIEVSEDVVLLDKNVWHHYGLLINRYNLNKRGAQSFPAITPQAGLRQYVAEVEYKDKTTFNAGGQKLRANRFIVLQGDGYEAEVIADESNRVLSIEVSALETKAVLQL